jgi:hypothetical protein
MLTPPTSGGLAGAAAFTAAYNRRDPTSIHSHWISEAAKREAQAKTARAAAKTNEARERAEQ